MRNEPLKQACIHSNRWS